KFAAAIEQVTEVLEDPIDTTPQRETDDDIRAVRTGQVINDVRQQRIVAARHEVRHRTPAARQVVGTARDHGTDSATWIADVTVIAGDEVNVKMTNGLARGGADVDADVEAVRTMAREDRASGDIERTHQCAPLLRSRIKPRG